MKGKIMAKKYFEFQRTVQFKWDLEGLHQVISQAFTSWMDEDYFWMVAEAFLGQKWPTSTPGLMEYIKDNEPTEDIEDAIQALINKLTMNEAGRLLELMVPDKVSSDTLNKFDSQDAWEIETSPERLKALSLYMENVYRSNRSFKRERDRIIAGWIENQNDAVQMDRDEVHQTVSELRKLAKLLPSKKAKALRKALSNAGIEL
jgi:hypothetical protein